MKTCIVGFTPDHAGQEALALAKVMTATSGSKLIVCTVVPEAWGHPSLGAVDQEYANFLSEYLKDAHDKARKIIGDMPDVRYIRYGASSATVGITEAAKQENADIIVLGSSREGSAGRLSMGGVATEIMHLSEIPVAMAPRDYRVKKGVSMPRLTCAYSGAQEASGTVLEAVGLATEFGVPLRLVSFAVRDRQMYPSVIGYQAENGIQAVWREQAQASLERVQGQLSGNSTPVEIAVAEGETWTDAINSIEWEEGEVLALGSSRMGLLRRVFLGSNANKIMKASPVPVMVLPRAS